MGILRGEEYPDTRMYQTVKVFFDNEICTIQIHRPEANNTINNLLLEEIAHVLFVCESAAKVVILEGLPDVFCFGADFGSMVRDHQSGGGSAEASSGNRSAERLYDIWLQLSAGPFITIAHVRGKANAGGVGFVAACDLVISDDNAVFSLSELLFGLMPACVLPFLIRRMGYSKANYMTMMTKPVTAKQAQLWGLVDEVGENSQNLLGRHLLRLRLLSKTAISRYKKYIFNLDHSLINSKAAAIAANSEVFSDVQNIEVIARYVLTGKFPWED